MPKPVTRFAPSPTGLLHIGGARTALFNWAFARRHKGRFLLRIEDTDRARASSDALHSILEGLRWLELDWDGEPVHQSARAERHRAAAHDLLAAGRAFWCDAPAKQDAAPEQPAASDKPAAAVQPSAPVLRFRAPRGGQTIVQDRVQGRVEIAHEQVDDFVLLRADGSPTYMLSCVVDDYDMGVTHIIRGDDHLTNAARQQELCAAFGWQPPHYAHLPLLHDKEGRKLSKRHHAASVLTWRADGYLAAAVSNYLSRLGWSHGDTEIFSRRQFVRWFALDAIGRAPARLDMERLNFLNAHYLRQLPLRTLLPLVAEFLPPSAKNPAPLQRAWEALGARCQTLHQIAEAARPLYAARPLPLSKEARELLTPEMRAHLTALHAQLKQFKTWQEAALHDALRAFLQQRELKMGRVAPALRAALTGEAGTLGVVTLLWALGRTEALARLADQAPQGSGAARKT